MAVAFDDLIDLCRRALGDVPGNLWDDATLGAWLLEACRDYSAHFQRVLSREMNCIAGIHLYALPDDFQAPLRVEHPTGQDPPRELAFLPRTDPRFWLSDGYYDWQPSRAEAGGGALWISHAPEAGQKIGLTYLALYYHAGVDPDAEEEVYVPDQHLPLLVMYVTWRAALERYFVEVGANPHIAENVAQLSEAADAARRQYAAGLAAAKAAGSQSQPTPPWKLDAWDRVY